MIYPMIYLIKWKFEYSYNLIVAISWLYLLVMYMAILPNQLFNYAWMHLFVMSQQDRN